MNHKHKTIVISFDGLGTADWKTIERLPAFARFLKEAAYCKQVETVYPSLTYPAGAICGFISVVKTFALGKDLFRVSLK